jgi:two-component system NtrC family sensor kinase
VTVLLVASYFRVQREVALFQNDMRHDHRVVGRTLARAVAEVWRLKGKRVALEVVAHANSAHGSVTVRWVHPDAPRGTPAAPRVSQPALASLREGRTTDLIVDEGDGLFCTYVPIHNTDAEYGAIEISEPLSHQRRYVRTTITQTAVTTGVVALVAVALAFLVGSWIVGRPVRALELKARRVGDGDLSMPLDLKRSDELGGLARELNAMCDRLAEAREHVQAETAARIATLEQLRHADRLSTVGKLSAGIAHELGTPLNVVQGRADMIQTGEVTGEEALDSARIIKEQAQRMSRIVRQLMQFARLRKPERAATDLREVARETIALLRPMADKRQVSVTLAPAAASTVAAVDPAQLQQSLTNLVMNAVQASPPGGVVQVDVGRRRGVAPADLGGTKGDYAFVSVVDRGPGMAPEVTSRVFEPFFTTKGIGEGTGLGLAVSFGIIREHGGWISVESKPGQGSIFTIHLPENTQS